MFTVESERKEGRMHSGELWNMIASRSERFWVCGWMWIDGCLDKYMWIVRWMSRWMDIWM